MSASDLGTALETVDAFVRTAASEKPKVDTLKNHDSDEVSGSAARYERRTRKRAV